MRTPLTLALGCLTACSLMLPATWGAFRADPDDIAPAVKSALNGQSLDVAKWEPTRIVSEYHFLEDGVDRSRERYEVWWERSDEDGGMVVYVRHVTQAQQTEDGRPIWARPTHDTAKESALLDAISEELRKLRAPPPSKT